MSAKLRLLIRHSLTWLILAQTVLTAVLANGTLNAVPSVARYAATAATGLGVIVTFLRKEEAWSGAPASAS